MAAIRSFSRDLAFGRRSSNLFIFVKMVSRSFHASSEPRTRRCQSEAFQLREYSVGPSKFTDGPAAPPKCEGRDSQTRAKPLLVADTSPSISLKHASIRQKDRSVQDRVASAGETTILADRVGGAAIRIRNRNSHSYQNRRRLPHASFRKPPNAEGNRQPDHDHVHKQA